MPLLNLLTHSLMFTLFIHITHSLLLLVTLVTHSLILLLTLLPHSLTHEYQEIQKLAFSYRSLHEVLINMKVSRELQNTEYKPLRTVLKA